MREVRCMGKEERVVIKRVVIKYTSMRMYANHWTCDCSKCDKNVWWQESNVRYVSNVRNGASEMSDVE